MAAVSCFPAFRIKFTPFRGRLCACVTLVSFVIGGIKPISLQNCVRCHGDQCLVMGINVTQAAAFELCHVAILKEMSKRGQTLCPGCQSSFNNRHKPENCHNCNFYLGGSFHPKEKKTKLNAPQCVKLFSKEGCCFYSSKMHSKDSRCIVIVDEHRNLKQCLAAKCKDARAAFVNSGKAEEFTCEHIAHCEAQVAPHIPLNCHGY